MVQYNCELVRDARMAQPAVRLSGPGQVGDGQTIAQFAPSMGSNLYSLAVDGTEYLCGVSPEMPAWPLLGTPILYPMPNRVRNAQFVFAGRTYRFQPNNGPHFIHGLVRDQAWECGDPIITADGASIKTWITFEPGKPIYDLFPIRNTLELTLALGPGRLRFDFAVRNEDAAQDLPFGLAIHPFFAIVGPRESVRLQVPAKKWMEAEDLLPTGRLVDLEQGPADLRRPVSLGDLDIDDVFWGMEEARPAVIRYDSIGKQLTLTASEFFTHAVVYTPPARSFYCVENQSCSTDAHNLYARGLQQAAHLVILGPGESLSAWVEMAVSNQ